MTATCFSSGNWLDLSDPAAFAEQRLYIEGFQPTKDRIKSRKICRSDRSNQRILPTSAFLCRSRRAEMPASRMSKPAKFERELIFRSADFPMDVSTWENHPDYPVVTNDFFEINIVVAGTALKQVAGQVYPLKAGDVFALRGGTPHGYRNTRGLTIINVTYDPIVLENLKFDVAELPGYQNLFFVGSGDRPASATVPPKGRKAKSGTAAGSSSYRVMHLNIEQLQQIRKLAQLIEQELHPGNARRRAVVYRDRNQTAISRYEPPPRDGACQFMAMAHFMHLVGLLSRWRFHKPRLVSEKLINIERAIDHLQHHFAEDLVLAALAQQVGLSYRNFHRLFQRATGHPPASYLRHLRLTRAAKLLQTTDKSITDIALACGFTDSSYFARSFRQEIGVAPREFRTNVPQP